MLNDEERFVKQARLEKATNAAKKVLKRGDRITVTKCPGTKRWIIFDHWNGNEIISARERENTRPRTFRGSTAPQLISTLNWYCQKGIVWPESVS